MRQRGLALAVLLFASGAACSRPAVAEKPQSHPETSVVTSTQKVGCDETEENRKTEPTSPGFPTLLGSGPRPSIPTIRTAHGCVPPADIRPFDKPGEAQEFFALKRAAIGEKGIPTERYLVAKEHMRRMRRFSTKENRFLTREHSPMAISDSTFAGTWTPLGPGNVGGRTRVLLIDPIDSDTMYAAGVAGGVWKTTNGGSTWYPLDDVMPNLAVNSMAMDPADRLTIYAGTGEGYFSLPEGARAVRGAGIFKTTDGGGTWGPLPSTINNQNFYYVNDIVVSANNSTHVYAATNTGVWRSLDSGDTWTVVIGSLGLGCLDLVIRTDVPTDYVFASCNPFDSNSDGFFDGEVWRNTDAANFGFWVSVKREPGMGRTSLAIAPSDQSIIYALSASVDPISLNGLHQVFRSDYDGAEGTWNDMVQHDTRLNTVLLSNAACAFDCFGTTVERCDSRKVENLGNLGFYANVITVDPVNPDRVWVGGIDLFRSDDGGKNWGLASYWWASETVADHCPPRSTNTNYVHADQHGIVFHPEYDGVTNKTMFVANDGGLFKTTDALADTATGDAEAVCVSASSLNFTNLNNNYAVTQFYYGAPYPDGNTYFGGTQDNGTIRGTDVDGTEGWQTILGGDGGAVAVDPTNTQTLYAEFMQLSIHKSTDGGTCFTKATDGITESSNNFMFIAPFVMDPNDSERLWTGGSRVWRTDNGAYSWTEASAPLAPSGKASAIAVAPTNSNFVLVGKKSQSSFNIHRTQTGLTAASSTVWPVAQTRFGYVSSLAFDPTDENIAYATYSTFGGTHVWKSTDGGVFWSPLDGPGNTGDPGHLPDIPVHSIVVDPDDTQRLYIGTDLGVFVSIDSGASWAVENTGFANVVTEALVVNGNELFAFTHGRGAWRVQISPSPVLPSVSISDASVTEGDAGFVEAVFTLTLTEPSPSTVTVKYATADGTATAPADYTSTSGTLSFAPGVTSKTKKLLVKGDTIAEGTETFFVNLSDADGALIGRGTGVGTIVDNDVVGAFRFSVANYTVNESLASATITVTRSGGKSGGGSVQYVTSDGSATAPGDYSATVGTLTFNTNILSRTFTVPINRDTVHEASEVLLPRLFNPTGPGSTLGTPNTATLTIIDDDPVPLLQFAAPKYTATEAKGSVTVTVKRIGSPAKQVSVDFATSDGTASAGQDYDPTSGTLMFEPGVVTRAFSVTIADDAVADPDEMINLTLSNPQPPTGADLGTVKTATVTITDNDQGLQFSTTNYTVSETAPKAIISVNRTGGTSGTVKVDYAATGGTAENGTDYTLASGTLSFGPGQALRTFAVNIHDDNDVEGSETVELTLSNAMNATVVGVNPAVLTITDNEPVFRFLASKYGAAETAPKATITVKRTGALTNPASVDYQITGGTATVGIDYTAASGGTLSFGAGQRTRTLSLAIINDKVDEPADTVILALGNPSAGYGIGTPGATILTINDNDVAGKAQFSASSHSVAEDGRSVIIAVTRTGGTSEAATVDYLASPGPTNPATEGVDYAATSGTLTFDAGQTTQTFTVHILTDGTPDGNKSVTLTLSNPGGNLTLGMQSTTTLWIVDID